MSHFIHPNAVCESTSVGQGTRIWSFSHVMKDAVLGELCNLGEHVFIESGVQIGNGCTIKNGVSIWNGVTLRDHVFVGPGVVFTNDLIPRAFIKRSGKHFLPTLISEGVTLGANATILCGTTIGKYAFIGAGAVVLKSISDHALIVGNPGRMVGKVCFCGKRLTDEIYCTVCELVLNKNSAELAKENLEAKFKDKILSTRMEESTV